MNRGDLIGLSVKGDAGPCHVCTADERDGALSLVIGYGGTYGVTMDGKATAEQVLVRLQEIADSTDADAEAMALIGEVL